MKAPTLELPAIPASEPAGADAARAALDAAAAPSTDDATQPTTGTGEASTAPLISTGEPGPRDRVKASPAPVVGASSSSDEPKKKLSKRALAELKKGALVREVVARDAEIAALETKLAAVSSSAAVVQALAPDHHKKLAREAVLTISGAAVVLTQDGRWQLNPRQIDRLSEAYGEVIRLEVPAALQSSPWGAAIMATLGVATEKYLEIRQDKKASASEPAASPAA